MSRRSVPQGHGTEQFTLMGMTGKQDRSGEGLQQLAGCSGIVIDKRVVKTVSELLELGVPPTAIVQMLKLIQSSAQQKRS